MQLTGFVYTETHFPSGMSSPTQEKRIPSDMCSPTPEKHIPSDMCSPTLEKHIPSDMRSPTQETHVANVLNVVCCNYDLFRYVVKVFFLVQCQ